MPEITLEQTGTDSIEDLIPMTNMVDQMLPNADSKLKTKLRIKIYNLSRTRNWPWVTVKKRWYYKPNTAKIIIGSVSDYADAILKKEQEDKKAAAKPKPKVKKARPVRTPKIIKEATKNAELNKDMKQKLRKRIPYIAKIDLIKPVQGRTIYSAKDAKQIVSELAPYYQQLQHDIHLNKEARSKRQSNQKNNKSQNNKKQSKRENNNQPQEHPFEIKSYHNNYHRNNRRQNYRQRSSNLSLQERYDNLLNNYTQLQERYNKLLNEKNNLINEKAKQLTNRFDGLRDILAEVLKRY